MEKATEQQILRDLAKPGITGLLLSLLTLLCLAPLALPSEAQAAGWSAAGSMATAHLSHSATLLPAGKVLVAGGWDNSAELYDPATNNWNPAGSMATIRSVHSATLLPSGKVLVAGGWNNDYLASAELYDPATNGWSPAGSMATARYGHSATLLPSGKVLVAGGDSNSGFLASAELYDPATNSWSTAAAMASTRTGHTATLLPNGNVLVAGGYGNSPLASAELYDPATNSWSPTAGSLATARGYHTATLLPTGKVLVAGGDSNSGFLASAELYDPATNSWSPAAGSLATARGYHSATLLPSGKVLVAGGWSSDSSAELYDPATNSWSPAGSLATARHDHSATLLPNGKVLVAGGRNSSDYLASADLYDPAESSWSPAGAMATARGYHSATLLPSGKVLVAGGWNGSRLASTELYDPATNSWSPAGSLATARSGHTATLLPSGKVLVAGGWGNDSYLVSAELYDPATNSWSSAGAMATARGYHSATLLPSGKVLVAGGYGNSPLASAELYDPAVNSWSSAGALATARGSHSATLLPTGKVLVAGEFDNGSSYLVSAELYDPAANSWSPAGAMATVRDKPTAALLPTGKVLVAGGGNNSAGLLTSGELYDSATNSWSPAGALATARFDRSATLLSTGKVLVAGGGASGSYFANAELYDPATNSWSSAGSMTTARAHHSATLLPSGRVLVAGGINNSEYLASADLYDTGLGYDDAWRPAITDVAPMTLNSALFLVGRGFSGFGNGEASGGTTNSSAANYPLVQLRSIDSGQMTWLGMDSFSSGGFSSLPVTNFPAGPAMITAFVNGIPSISQYVTVNKQTVSGILGNINQTYDGSGKLVTVTALPEGLTPIITYNGSTTPPTAAGTYVVAVTFNSPNYTGTIYGTLIINKAATTTTITSAPTPSDIGSPVTVSFSVTSSAGTPTGNVTVSNGAASCTVSVATGSCSLTFHATGTTTLTATYAGDSLFSNSASTGVSHTTNQLPAAVVLTPSSLYAGSLAVGSTGVVQTVTLANAGGSTLTIGNIPSAAGDYAATSNCPASLAPGASCIISVTFTPTAPGSRSASLVITDSLGTHSIALTGVGIPAVPTAKAATSGTATGFTAQWGAVTGATGYRLDVAANSGFTSLVSGYGNKNVGNVTSSAVSGLTAGTIYYYRVRACNAGGASGNSNTISKRTIPAVPTAKAATSGTATGFTAQWGTVAGATGYRLDVAANSGFTSLVSGYSNKNVGNVTSSAVSGLTAGTTYYYRVRACNAGGASDNSNTISKRTIPAIPTAKAATSVTATGFTAQWGAVTGVTGYRLDVAANSGFTSLVSGYDNKNVGSVTSSAVSGLTAGTTYYYRVRAYNAGGASGNSNTISKRTIPAVPTAKAATSVTATGFTANWGAVAGVTGYRLDVATNSGFTSLVSGYGNKNVGNVTSSAVSGLTIGTTYYYRVRAYNASGASGNSNTISKQTIPLIPTVKAATSATRIGPTLALSMLADGTITNTPTSNVSGTVTALNSITGLIINTADVAVAADGSFSHAIHLNAGPNDITTTVIDAAKNTTTDSRTIYLEWNTPILNITGPADNSVTAAGFITITGNADENSTVTSSMNGSTPQEAQRIGTGFEVTHNLIKGLNTALVTVKNMDGNRTMVKRTITYTPDAPAIAITAPAADMTTEDTKLNIKGTITEAIVPVSATITVNGVTSPLELNTDGSFAHQVNLGQNQKTAITVTAIDQAGNRAHVQRNVIFEAAK